MIERPIDATLDVNGWDLRKAMQLMLRSNAVLLEWLCSPVRYRNVTEVTAPFAALARETADLTALCYHYDRQARRSFDEILSAREGVRLKTYFYALRPALALRWIRSKHEPPPMDLPTLMAGLTIPDEVRRHVDDLLVEKAGREEQDLCPRIMAADEFIGTTLSEPVGRPSLIDRKHNTAKADALFASIALDRQTIADKT